MEQSVANKDSRMEGAGTLTRGLKLLYVYALSTGAILTFIGYWDGIFLTGAGPATFLSFFLMTLMVLPIAFVYSELATMLPYVGAELVYNTVGINKHFGFFSAWLIMAAWIAVPPAAVFGILDWINFAFKLEMTHTTMMIIGIITLVVYCGLSMYKNVVAGQIQTFMLFAALGGVILTGFIFIFSDQWSWSNFTPFFRSAHAGGGATGSGGIYGWVIGTALIVTPYFGFETVPQMVEEGTFPIKNMYKAILGSVLTCGALYIFFFFALAGMGPWEVLTENGTSAPFVAIKVIESWGWMGYALFFGIVGVLFTIGTCLLGFWMSSVRLLYAMGRQNFLPKAFAKTNRFGQPIVPNLLVLGISLAFFALQSELTYIQDYFSLMAFACAAAYAITMIASMLLAKNHPEWERPYKLRGGQTFRVFAFIIALGVAVLCLLGQNATAFQGLGMYLGIGVLLWIWMVVAKWPKEPVWMETPEGAKDY